VAVTVRHWPVKRSHEISLQQLADRRLPLAAMECTAFMQEDKGGDRREVVAHL